MATVLDMSISLDGFIAGPHEEPEPIERLHHWIFAGNESGEHGVPGIPDGVNGMVIRELMETGAVVAPRRTFQQGEGWHGDHHNGVPIFVLSRRPAPDDAAKWPLVTYVSDVGEALRRAQDAAGERDVLVHGGAGTLARALDVGALDEIAVHIVPVLLGSGRQLFSELSAGAELERVRVLEGEDGVTHLRYRVVRASR
jgi:dihydrofolate reductase